NTLKELKKTKKNMGLHPRVNEFFTEKQSLDDTQNLKNDDASTNADVQINICQQVRSFTEWHASSLQMLRALKRIGAATKNNDTQTGENSYSSISAAISRQELLELDVQMRQQQQVVHEQSKVMYAHAPRLKIVSEDESQFGFPLT
ncbi:MAG: methyltransferase type 11, partial [Glaciecola sp.]